jgi:hypothetical protein
MAKNYRGTKEEVQNRVLFGFEKSIRQSGSKDENRPLSLKEQLEQAEREREEEFMKNMSTRATKSEEKVYFVPAGRLNK